MRLILAVLVATSANALFFGCGSCGGFGGGYGGGLSYGGGYSYGDGISSYGGYGNYGNSFASYGLPNMNAPGSYFQPTSQGATYQTLYAGRPYFTPVDSGFGGGYSTYGGSYGSSYPSYGQSNPVYTQILPLPANAQIVNNIPAIPQAVGGGGYAARPSYPTQVQSVSSSYARPSVVAQVQPQTSYIQPSAPVATEQDEVEQPAIAPTAAPVSIQTEDYNESVTEAPATAAPRYPQPAAPVYKTEVPATKMINSPEEAGYRKKKI